MHVQFIELPREVLAAATDKTLKLLHLLHMVLRELGMEPQRDRLLDLRKVSAYWCHVSGGISRTHK